MNIIKPESTWFFSNSCHSQILCCCIFLISLVMLFGFASAQTPAAAFNGTPTSGTAPLTVSFTDQSTGSPTGWAWYFGDENYTQTWTQMTAGAGWLARSHHSSVVMPDGSIVLMGGWNSDTTNLNDVWKSTDNGETWTQVTRSAGWSARDGPSSVVMPDGSIVLMGGRVGAVSFKNDVWRSTDNGATWIQVNASAGWSARSYHSSVVMPDGSIVLMGGYTFNSGRTNDVWRSTDNGATWTQMTASAGWSARDGLSSVVMTDGSIVLMGGYWGPPMKFMNDVWQSTDNGATWTQVNASAGWSARSYHSSVVMPDGSIVLIGGLTGDIYRETDANDVWRSTDNGATWTQMTASAGWSARESHSSVVMTDGSLVLMGGNTFASGRKNDVWRVIPTGSSIQNPSHTYTAPGTYQAALQVYNADGYNSTRKTGYITVNAPPAPVPNFTSTPRSGTAPLTVTFNDSSTNSPTSWNWSFGDGATSTSRNPVHTYTIVGTYTVSLTASNAGGSNTVTHTNFITVNAPPAPVPNFTSTPRSGAAPLTVTFNDSSTNSPTSWNWSFGDGATSTSRDPVHTYTIVGTYTVSLTVTNAGGSNTVTHTNFITVNAPVAPVADFTATSTFGTAPLTVSFTDQSTGSPTGWAWYFGDENYTQTWTQMTASAGWSKRIGYSSVAMPDGSIVLMGGYSGTFLNDVWRSMDCGATWIQVNKSAGWSVRNGHSSVATPGGSIILMGGIDITGNNIYKNDVWRSTDNGVTWTQMTASAGWTARSLHTSAAMADGSIVLMGGADPSGLRNDVWRSTDDGATWIQMNASAGWTGRTFPRCVAMPDGSIVLMGGYLFKNDDWRSMDYGATWTQVTPSAAWSERTEFASVAMPDGSIVLMGGSSLNDVWRSTDDGAMWTRVNRNAGWTGRFGHTSMAMPDGSIILIGGQNDYGYNNDVWRFMPAGSTERNPSHTYTTPGTYQVALQAYNASGYSSIRKTGYITVYINEGSGSDYSTLPDSITTSLPSKNITEIVNVGGGSAITRSEVTGTDLGRNLVITAFPRDSLPEGIAVPQTTVYQYISITTSTIPWGLQPGNPQFQGPAIMAHRTRIHCR